MEVIQETVDHLYSNYEWALTIADKRVADWPLMQSYTPTLVLTMLYLLVVYSGQKIMKNRQPFHFRWTLFFYNMGLVILNFHICLQLVTWSWRLKYSFTCQMMDYSDHPGENAIAKALWWYYFSKLIEFMDTIFFVLRKKNNQISFLHVYHHATMFPIWWIGIKWVPGGQSFFGAAINSFIHILMYTYYGVSSLGPKYQKYLSWKRYLTTLQLIQFIVGMAHAANSIFIGCPFVRWMQWALIFYGLTILFLFLNFYFQAYIKPKHSKKLKKSAADSNGHISNGTPLAVNGHPECKKTKKTK